MHIQDRWRIAVTVELKTDQDPTNIHIQKDGLSSSPECGGGSH